jgi:hypothetical protein
MINHARTLLANLNPFNAFDGDGYLGEELIDPGFIKLRLPGYLEVIRKTLFGETPDRDMINYRCRQFMTMLHSGPLEGHVMAMDPRVTYSTGLDASLMPDGVFAVFQQQFSGGTDSELDVFGSPEAPDHSGRMYRSYTVRTIDADTLDVEPQGSSNLVFEYALTEGLSNPIPLPWSGYKVRLRVSGGGYAWTVYGRNRPQWDLGQIVEMLGSVGHGALDNLFLGNDEPYVSYRNLWLRQSELPLKLGGLIMAVIKRTEEVRSASS